MNFKNVVEKIKASNTEVRYIVVVYKREGDSGEIFPPTFKKDDDQYTEEAFESGEDIWDESSNVKVNLSAEESLIITSYVDGLLDTGWEMDGGEEGRVVFDLKSNKVHHNSIKTYISFDEDYNVTNF